MIKTKNQKVYLDGISKLGIFSASLLVAASAVYLYSPVIGSHASETATPKVDVNVGTIIALNTDKETVSMNALVNSFVHAPVTVGVSTNSQYGYTLTLEDADSSANMTHTNTSITDVVTSTFSGSKTSSTMDANTWGWSLDATDYYKVPVNGSPVRLKNVTTAQDSTVDETDVDFGVKVGVLTSGTYRDTVVFTAYVNGSDGEPILPPSTMQSFSCSSLSNVGDSATLTDSRDNNTYTVKKLADGNCWMTENLKIANKTLTSDDSDLPSGTTWTVPASDVYSFSDSMNRGANDFNQNNAYVNSYGGYYSFYSATAGWGTGGWYGEGVSSGDSPCSICPKGWRLPTGGEFETLYDDYGSSDSAMMGEPGFVLSGMILDGGEFHQDENAQYWASTVESTDYAHFFYFNPDGGITHPDYYYYKGGGYSVRCVAR